MSARQLFISLFALSSLLFPTSAFAQTASPSGTIRVSAVVPASASDFSAAIASDPSSTTVSQDTTITYTITYGSTLSYATAIDVQANWSLGTPEGSSTPSISLLSYVPGSAGLAHGNTAAVIDTVNKKITWSISTFPGNTTKTVNFQLKTNSYTTSTPISFTVSTRVLGPGVSSTDATDTKAYVNTTSTSTSATSTPTATHPQTTTSAAGPKTPLRITNISVETIETEAATIVISTSKLSSLKLQYGTTQAVRDGTITSLQIQKTATITLAPLQRNTRYYFRVIASSDSETASSDIYTFITAKEKPVIQIKEDSLIITSNHILLYSPRKKGNDMPYIIVPEHTTIEVNFQVNDPSIIRSIQGSLKNNQVLGTNTFTPLIEANKEAVSLFSLKNDLYTGRLQTTSSGEYDLIIRIHDYDGNVTDKKVADIYVKKPLFVYEESSGKPVENAEVRTSYYNEGNKIYESIPTSSISIPNPAYAESTGRVNLVLPEGKYQIAIKALGYESQTITFLIGKDSKESYPTVFLKKTGFNIITAINDLVATCINVYHSGQLYILDLAQSYRFFRLHAAIILLCFIFLTYMAFSARLRMHLHRFPLNFANYWHWAKKAKDERGRLIGSVFDVKTRFPIIKATIMLFSKNDRLVFQTSTDKQGVFYVPIHTINTYKLLITKPGFSVHEETIEKITTDILSIPLTQKRPRNYLHAVLEVAENITSSLFESFLILSFLLELFLASNLGLSEALPFLILSFCNLVLWLLVFLSYYHIKRIT
jgi:hypothetical protein